MSSRTKDPSESQFSRRQMLRGMGLTLVGALLTACGATPTAAPVAKPTTVPTAAKAEPIEIVFHSRTGQQEYYEAEAKNFNSIQDKVRVKLELTPHADYITKLTTLAAGGEPR